MKRKFYLFLLLVIACIGLSMIYRNFNNSSGTHSYSESVTIEQINEMNTIVIANNNFTNGRIQKGDLLIIKNKKEIEKFHKGQSVTLVFLETTPISYKKGYYHLSYDYWLEE